MFMTAACGPAWMRWSRVFESELIYEHLLQEIEAQIAGVKTAVAKQNVGIVREIGDGVAKIEGLTDAMLNEMLDFGNGVIGLALNLEETEVGAIILGDYTQAPRRPRSPHHRQAACRCPSAKDCWAAS